jgi:predicted PurR-regulated permease PerM
MTERLPRILVVVLVVAGLTIMIAGLRATAGIVGPTMLALVLTITVHPLRPMLARFKLPDWAISLILVVVVYLLLLAVVIALIFAIGQLATILPTYADEINKNTKQATGWFADHGVGSDEANAAADAFDPGSLVSVITGLFGAILDVFSSLFFIVTLALFMGFDTSSTQRVFAYVRSLKADLVDAVAHFAHATRVYMAVTTTFGLIVAVIDGVALLAMGLPGAFTWAVLAFVTNFIPNIGFVIGLIPPAIIALLEGGPVMMLQVIAIYSVINVVIQSVIQPRVVGNNVGLTPTITMLSLVFWAWAIGALGALLAVPMTLLMRALLVEADPAARWVLPLISGRLPEAEPGAPPDAQPDDSSPDLQPDDRAGVAPAEA